MVCGLMSRVQHTVCSVERDVGFFPGIWEKSLGTWHNGAPVVPRLQLIHQQYCLLGEKLQFSHYISRLYFDCQVFSGLRSSASCLLFLFFSSVSSLSSFASSCLTGRVLERDKTHSLEEGLNYCHRCPTKSALSCFSPLWVTLNVPDCHSL